MKTTMTFAFDVLWQCTRNLIRRSFHATVNGFRAEVAHDGQLYEVIVNPLYQEVPETFEDRKCYHDQEASNV